MSDLLGCVECTECKKIIDWNGECDCNGPFPPMTSDEYKARFIHPFMRRTMRQLNGEDETKH
jgi:hypothetical protein